MREPRNQTCLCEAVNIGTSPSPWPRQMGKRNCCDPAPGPVPSSKSCNTREAPCWLKSLQKWGRGRDWGFSPPCCEVSSQMEARQRPAGPGTWETESVHQGTPLLGAKGLQGTNRRAAWSGTYPHGNLSLNEWKHINSGAFVLHQCSSFHIDSGEARIA